MKILPCFLIFTALSIFGCTSTPQKNGADASVKTPRETAYHNPVLNQDFPDPTVIKANGKFYAYATQGRVDNKMLNIQVASSSDMQNWQIEGDALPQQPAWANTNFWAPHVLYDAEMKKYVMFYSGESTDTTTGKCLGVAFADNPTGPFIDKGTPLLCGEGFVNIDPMAFKDPGTGKKLLYWGSGFEPIKVQELTADWTAFKPGTTPKPVVWPGKDKNYNILIEGAWIDLDKGYYYLYYSGDNCCGDKANYAVMVARSKNPLGPFERYGESNGTGSSVILEKDSVWLAPGHNSIIVDDKGNKWIAYHGIWRGKKNLDKAIEGDRKDRRVMNINPIKYKGGWPVVVK